MAEQHRGIQRTRKPASPPPVSAKTAAASSCAPFSQPTVTWSAKAASWRPRCEWGLHLQDLGPMIRAVQGLDATPGYPMDECVFVVEAFWQNRLSVAQERLLLLLVRAEPKICAQTPLRPEAAGPSDQDGDLARPRPPAEPQNYAHRRPCTLKRRSVAVRRVGPAYPAIPQLSRVLTAREHQMRVERSVRGACFSTLSA